MLKKYKNEDLVWFVLAILLLSACAPNPTCRIIGTVPDSRLEGEWIYSVPLEGATQQTVDSVQIRNGRFEMEVRTDTPAIRILRPRPIMRLLVQELLIVAEPVEIRVWIDSVSRASGTPLNDSLQQWKERRERQSEAMQLIRKMRQAGSEADSIQANAFREQWLDTWRQYNYEFVRNNADNVVGKFVYRQTFSLFTPEQRRSFPEITIE